MIDKIQELSKYSNFEKVKKIGKKYNLDILPSTRNDKKYMFIHKGKKVHFGQMGYQDYHKHLDKQRLKLFRTRNNKWKDSPIYTPAWASYYILW